jgi:hypothetical protein
MSQLTEARHSYLRPLSALEKMFWYADQKHPNHFCIVGIVDGEADNACWQRALDAAASRSPLAWSRIIPDAQGAPHFWEGPAGSVPLRSIDADPQKWQREVAAELACPFDAEAGPLVRAVLLRRHDQAGMILVAHHAIADGLSLTYLLRDVLRELAGEHAPRSSESRAAETIALATLASLPAVEPGAAPSPVPFRSPDNSLPAIASLSLDECTTALLRDRCRAEATTVHCLLGAAVARAASTRQPEDRSSLRILSPLDMRKPLLGSSEHLGLCVLGVVSEHRHVNGSLWDAARGLSPDIGHAKSAEGLAMILSLMRLCEPHLVSVPEAATFLASAFGCDILLTNLGPLVIAESYGPLQVKSVWGPSVAMGFAEEQTIGVTTFGGRLHLLHTSYAPTGGLLQETLQEIRVALET